MLTPGLKPEYISDEDLSSVRKYSLFQCLLVVGPQVHIQGNSGRIPGLIVCLGHTV